MGRRCLAPEGATALAAGLARHPGLLCLSLAGVARHTQCLSALRPLFVVIAIISNCEPNLNVLLISIPAAWGTRLITLRLPAVARHTQISFSHLLVILTILASKRWLAVLTVDSANLTPLHCNYLLNTLHTITKAQQRTENSVIHIIPHIIQVFYRMGTNLTQKIPPICQTRSSFPPTIAYWRNISSMLRTHIFACRRQRHRWGGDDGPRGRPRPPHRPVAPRTRRCAPSSPAPPSPPIPHPGPTSYSFRHDGSIAVFSTNDV